MNKNLKKNAINEFMSYVELGDNIINNNIEVLNLNEIYHYTSPKGFKSIIEHSKIRFTDSRFLNDIEEQFNISNTLKKILNEPNINLKKGIIDVLEKYTNTEYLKELFNKKKRFIFSCTKSNDELSLWNYYIKQNNYIGYSIGFSPRRMLDFLEKNDDNTITSHKCLYNDNEKQIYLMGIINKAEEALNAKAFQNKQMKHVLDYLDDCIYISSIIFKNEKFSSENEIRFICEKKSLASTNQNIQYRLNNGIMIPYIEIDIDLKDIISSVTIGPGKQDDFVLQGTKEFLSKNKINIKSEYIQDSKIPLRRSWNL